jgi:hypothetical protein
MRDIKTETFVLHVVYPDTFRTLCGGSIDLDYIQEYINIMAPRGAVGPNICPRCRENPDYALFLLANS